MLERASPWALRRAINNPATSRDVRRIATFLSEDDRDALLRAEATTIAECEVTLARIRAARVARPRCFRSGGWFFEADKLTFGKRVRAILGNARRSASISSIGVILLGRCSAAQHWP